MNNQQHKSCSNRAHVCYRVQICSSNGDKTTLWCYVLLWVIALVLKEASFGIFIIILHCCVIGFDAVLWLEYAMVCAVRIKHRTCVTRVPDTPWNHAARESVMCYWSSLYEILIELHIFACKNAFIHKTVPSKRNTHKKSWWRHNMHKLHYWSFRKPWPKGPIMRSFDNRLLLISTSC